MSENEERFHHNLEKWSRLNPQAAVFLPYLDPSHLVFCKTRQNEINLKTKVDGKTRYFHSNTDATRESERWFSKLNLLDTEVLYVYGVGLGYDYVAARCWLKQNSIRRLIFLEDDLAVIHRLLETEQGSLILEDPQVQMIFFDKADERDSPLGQVYWASMSLKMGISALRYYSKSKAKIFEELNHRVVYDATLHDSILSEYLGYGEVYFQNFYPNVLFLAGAYLGNNMAGRFRNVPAIICGAGPSLNKHLPMLGELKDKALIFGAGSALNSLNSVDLQPHFGAGIDPNPAQFDRLSTNTAFEVPFFYRNRLHHRAFRMIHGSHLFITGGGGYGVSEWFEKRFGIEGRDIDEGFNVVNFCLDIARVMGCDPIIMLGMDLAFTGMEAYAEGIQEDAKVNKEEILSGIDLDSKAILRKDIHGKPIYTLWKWVAESNWISDFGKACDQLGITLINSTEGGIGMKDIPNESLALVTEKYLTFQYDLSNRLHGEIQNSAMPQVTISALIEAMVELRDSLIRCQDHLKVLFEETEKVIGKITRKKQIPATLQSGLAALAEIELAEEPAYCHVLEVFNIVYSKVLNRELQQMLAVVDKPEWQQVIERLTINNKKLKFLLDTAEMHVKMVQRALDYKAPGEEFNTKAQSHREHREGGNEVA